MRVCVEFYMPRRDRLLNYEEEKYMSHVSIDMSGIIYKEEDSIPNVDVSTFFKMGGLHISYEPEKEPSTMARYSARGSFNAVRYAMSRWKEYLISQEEEI